MLRTSRGVTPVLGLVVLVACCVVAGGVLAVAVTDAGTAALAAPAAPSVVDASAAADGTLALTYRAGPPLDVRELRAVVLVDGRALREQPPVPFVGAPGFDGAPIGAFNAAADPTWRVGERVGLRVAATNAPRFHAGARVTIWLYRDGARVAVAETRVAPTPRGPRRAS